MYPFEIYVKYQDCIEEACAKYQVSQARICAKIFKESSGNPQAFREEPQINDASYGLMQILWQTAQSIMNRKEFDLPKLESPQELFNPRINLLYGCAYYSYLLALYNGCPNCAEAHYVSGEARFCSSTGDLVVNRHVRAIDWWTKKLISDPRYREIHNLDKSGIGSANRPHPVEPSVSDS